MTPPAVQRKLPWIVYAQAPQPKSPLLRCANYTTRQRAEAAVPAWQALYDEAGLPRRFTVVKR